MLSDSLEKKQVVLLSHPIDKILIFQIFITNTILTTIAYGLFFQLKFTADTYWHIYSTAEDLLFGHMSMGRPLAAIITFLLRNMGIIDGLDQAPYVISLVLAIGVCSTALFFQISRYIDLESRLHFCIVELASLLFFVNVFFVSWFMYTEASMLMALGSVCSIFAAIVIANVEKPICKYGLAFILLLMSICLYQVFMETFVIASCIFLVQKYNLNNPKECIKEIVKVLLLTLVAVCVNLSLTKYLCHIFEVPLSDRTASFTVGLIYDNIQNVIAFHPRLWVESVFLLPPYALLISFGLVISIYVFLVFARKCNLLETLVYLFVVIGSYFLVFSPHYISPIFWPVERTLFPLFAIFSMIIVIILQLTNKRPVLLTILTISLCFFCLNVIEIQDIASDQQITNSIDEEYAKMIDSAVSEYENNSNNIVAYIGIANDSDPSYGYYSQVDKIIYDTNVTARTHDWSFLPMLNYYTNRNYIMVDVPDDVYAEYFENRNWDLYDPSQQLVFVYDTLYICVY